VCGAPHSRRCVASCFWPSGVQSLPVNFRFFKDDVVFRTQGTGALATVAGGTVSFEVDHIDEATSEGWSVVVTGDAARVDDPSEVAATGSAGH
jgi:nitroimidazol reductase NimA-like FMN-containing flavoprotein (pyridoxamine 5'-phosphate oxidase superfamily)